MNNLMQEVKFEPKVALDGGHDGLRSYKKIFPHLNLENIYIKNMVKKNLSLKRSKMRFLNF